MRKLSLLAKKVYYCIKDDYNGIAETGNIEYELGLSGRAIANIGRALVNRNLIEVTAGGACTDVQLDTGITDPQQLFEAVCKNSGIKEIELAVVGYAELKKLINLE